MNPAFRFARPAASLLLAASLVGCSSDPAKPQNDAQAVETNRDKSDKLIARATEYTRSDQPTEAIECYKQAILLNPQHPYAWYNLGVLCSEQKRLAEANEAWKMAAALDPTYAKPLFALGLQRQQQGWLDDAASLYAQALERDPNDLDTLRKAVQVDQLQNRYTDVTLDRIRRALLKETDPQWEKFLRETQLKTLERVQRAGGNTGR